MNDDRNTALMTCDYTDQAVYTSDWLKKISQVAQRKTAGINLKNAPYDVQQVSLGMGNE